VTTKLKKGTSRERICKNAARLIADGTPQDEAKLKAVRYANQQARKGK
jgi:hypothetical protein